jgi:hypothetical protein
MSDDGFKPGMQVLAERKGAMVPGEVVSKSKKKEGHWAIRFESDGKLFPRPVDQIQVIQENAEEQLPELSPAQTVYVNHDPTGKFDDDEAQFYIRKSGITIEQDSASGAHIREEISWKSVVKFEPFVEDDPEMMEVLEIHCDAGVYSFECDDASLLTAALKAKNPANTRNDDGKISCRKCQQLFISVSGKSVECPDCRPPRPNSTKKCKDCKIQFTSVSGTSILCPDCRKQPSTSNAASENPTPATKPSQLDAPDNDDSSEADSDSDGEILLSSKKKLINKGEKGHDSDQTKHEKIAQRRAEIAKKKEAEKLVKEQAKEAALTKKNAKKAALEEARKQGKLEKERKKAEEEAKRQEKADAAQTQMREAEEQRERNLEAQQIEEAMNMMDNARKELARAMMAGETENGEKLSAVGEDNPMFDKTKYHPQDFPTRVWDTVCMCALESRVATACKTYLLLQAEVMPTQLKISNVENVAGVMQYHIRWVYRSFS